MDSEAQEEFKEPVGNWLGPIDILFYGLALYTGYRFSLRRLGEEELAEMIG